MRQVGGGGGQAGQSPPLLRQRPDKALLSGAQGSHGWLCKQPKREGTFPLAASAVKRLPVTVIAAFGGIISAQAVGGGGRGRGGRERHRETSGLLAELRDSRRKEPGARRRATAPSPAGLCRKVLDLLPCRWTEPPSQESPWGSAPSLHAAFTEIPGVTVFKTSAPTATS